MEIAKLLTRSFDTGFLAYQGCAIWNRLRNLPRTPEPGKTLRSPVVVLGRPGAAHPGAPGRGIRAGAGECALGGRRRAGAHRPVLVQDGRVIRLDRLLPNRGW